MNPNKSFFNIKSLLGIREVVYGCTNDKFGGCGSILSLHESISEHLSGLVSDCKHLI